MIKHIALSLLFASTVHAETVNLVFLQGNSWIGESRIDSFVGNLERYLTKGLKREITVASVRVITDPTTQQSLSDIKPKLFALEEYAISRKYIKGAALVHFIVPPFISDEKLFVAGLADRNCSLYDKNNSYSLSSAVAYNQDGVRRWEESIIAAAHEITHLFGGSHVSSKTLMNYQVLSLIPELKSNVPVSKKTLEQVRDCLEFY